MANTLIAYSTNNNTPHYFSISDDTGAQVAGPITASFAGGQTYKYTATVPALPVGYYTYSMHRTSNDALRSQGEFYWNGSDIVRTEEVELTVADVESAVATALATYDTATATDVSNSTAAILAAIPTANAIAVAVEAAIINDADGQTALAAISSAVESAIGNEADGNATLAAFQGAVTAALTSYGPSTSAELTTCCNDIMADIAALNNLSSADIISALGTYGAATLSDIASNSGLTAGQAAILTLIRDILEADETYTATGGTGTAEKLLKGTTTVLVSKTVTTSTPCDITTTLVE